MKRIFAFLSSWQSLLGAALIIAGASGYSGWTARSWRADADLARAEKRYSDYREAMRVEVAKQVRIAEEHGRDVARAYAEKTQAIDAGAASTNREILNAQREAAARGDVPCKLDPRWVQIYDAGLRPGSGANAAPGKPAGPSAGTSDAGSVDEWDVAFVNAENGRRWAQCRANLNSLIDFEFGLDKALGESSAPGVVTPSSKR